MSMASTPADNATQRAHPFQTDDPRLAAIHEKVIAGQPLGPDDIVSLYQSTDILAMGWLANFVRQRMVSNQVRVAISQVAVADSARGSGCRLCGAELSPRGWEQIAGDLHSVKGESLARISLVGALPTLEACCHMLQRMRQQFPSTAISAFAPSDVAELARNAAGDVSRTCTTLRQAGLDGLIGEGLEILLPNVVHASRKHQLPAARAAEVSAAAAAAGLSAPLNFVVNGSESDKDLAGVLLGLRDAAAKGSAKSVAVATIAGEGAGPFVPSTGMQEMKHIAIARLALQNAGHIRVFWETLGSKLAQVALRFGASELDASFYSPSGESIEGRRREAERLAGIAGGDVQVSRTELQVITSWSALPA